MGKRSRRMNPFQSMILEGQRREKRRACAQRMHGRSKIVQEAWQRQSHGARCTACDRLGLEHIDLQACLSQYDRRCQSIGTRANHTCLAAHRKSPTNVVPFAVPLMFERATISYSFGCTVGHSTTLIFPSDPSSTVGA